MYQHKEKQRRERPTPVIQTKSFNLSKKAVALKADTEKICTLRLLMHAADTQLMKCLYPTKRTFAGAEFVVNKLL